MFYQGLQPIAAFVRVQAAKVTNEMFRSLASPAAAGSKPMAVLDFQLPKNRWAASSSARIFLLATLISSDPSLKL